MPNDPTLSIVAKLKDQFTRQFQAMQKKTDRSTSKMAAGFGKLKGALVGAVAAYAGWVAVQKTWNAVKAYANLEAVERAFNNLRDRIGASENAVVRWNKAVRNTIGYADLFKEANKAIIAGAVKSEEEFTKLAEAAFYLARNIGEEVLPTFQQLMASLEAGSPRALRRFGIDMERIFYLERQRTGTTGTLPLEVKQRMMVEGLLRKALDIQRNLSDEDRKRLTTLEKIQQSQVDIGDAQEELGRAAKDSVEVYRELSILTEKIGLNAAKTVVEYKKAYDALESFLKARWWAIQARRGRNQGTPRTKTPMRGQAEITPEEQAIFDAMRIKNALDAGPQPGGTIFNWQARVRGGLPDETVLRRRLPLDMFMGAREGIRPRTQAEQMFAALKRGTNEYVEFSIDRFRHFSDAVTQTFQSLENTIGTVFFDAMMGDMKRFKDYVASFVRDISGILSQMFARQLVGSAVSGIGGLFGGFGGGSADSALFEGGVQQFASGGIVSHPSLITAGEAGPEAIIPLSHGRSVPVEMKSGGRTVNVNFHIRTNDAGSFRSSLVQNQEVVSGIIKKALGNDMQLRSVVRAV
jgi:hypothetical protein